MAFHKMICDSVDRETVEDWFNVLQTAERPFTPPATWESVNIQVEETCQRLDVDYLAVTTAVDAYDVYALHVVESNAGDGPDAGLAMLLCSWIADKLVGTRSEVVTFAQVQRYRAEHLPAGTETEAEVKALEFEIYRVVRDRLPAVTPMEDAAVVACHLSAELKLSEFTVERCQLLYKMLRLCFREVYTHLLWQFGDELHNLLSRRIVLPVAIVMACVRLYNPAHEYAVVLPLCAHAANISPHQLVVLSDAVFHVYVDRFHVRLVDYQMRGGDPAQCGRYVPQPEALALSRCPLCSTRCDKRAPGCCYLLDLARIAAASLGGS